MQQVQFRSSSVDKFKDFVTKRNQKMLQTVPLSECEHAIRYSHDLIVNLRRVIRHEITIEEMMIITFKNMFKHQKSRSREDLARMRVMFVRANDTAFRSDMLDGNTRSRLNALVHEIPIPDNWERRVQDAFRKEQVA